MDIGQAVRRLQNGDQVRRESWEDKARYLDPDGSEVIEPSLTYEDLFATDWETLDG